MTIDNNRNETFAYSMGTTKCDFRQPEKVSDGDDEWADAEKSKQR